MQTQSRASLFLVLLGVFAILSPVFATAGSQSAPSPKAAPAPVASAAAPASASGSANGEPAGPLAEQSDEQKLEAFCQARFERVLHDSFDIRAAPAPSKETNEAAWARIGASAGRSAETLIVTLPDPIDSGFYSQLDSDLDAVQIALNERYQPSHFWLAWNDTDAASKEDADRALGCRALVPSVMLFRTRGAKSGEAGYAVALLVGESPAWGLHRRTMAKALDFVAAASMSAHPEATSFDARIVGPVYSGTTSSLSETIRAWSHAFAADAAGKARPSPKLVVRSGGATNPRIANALHRPNGTPPIDFSATTVPDDLLKRAFYNYLWATDGVRLEAVPGQEHEKLLKQVAVLTESGTDYGSSFAAKAPPSSSRVSTPEPGASCTCDATDYLPEFVLHFPLHISSVRSAYNEAPSDGTTAFPAAPRTTLTPSLDERDDARDRPPNLSPRTKYAHDLALATLLDDIVHNDIRFVGLVATDPLDVIFLAQQIRKVTPDVRLFTFDAEILYSHPSFATDLDGMLVVSPYPFFGAGGFGNKPIGVEWTPFESQTAEGIYNATRSLVSPSAPLAEYSPFPGATDCQLPIWITALGHGGVWPLTMTGYCDCHDYVRAQGGTPGADHQCSIAQTSMPSGNGSALSTPLLWRIFRMIVGGGILAICILYLATRRIRGNDTLGALLRVELHKTWVARKTFAFDHLRRPADRQRQSARLFVCHAVLGVLYASISFVERLPVRVPEGEGARPMAATIIAQGWLVGGVFLCGCLVVGLLEALRDYVHCAREGIGRRIATTLAVDALIPLLTLGCAITAVCIGLHSSGAPILASVTDRFLLYRRSTDLASGLSLILPITFGCACLYTATLGSLRRLESYDALLVRAKDEKGLEPDEPPGPISRIFGRAPKSAGGLATTEQLLLRTFGSFAAMGRTYLAAALVFLAIPVVFLSIKPPMTLDGRAGNAIFVTLFLFCLVVTCSALVRLFAFSFRLKLFLSSIGRHPLAGAFARLPDAFVLTAEEQISSAPPTIGDFGICARQLAALGRDAARFDPSDVSPAIARIRTVAIDPTLEASLRVDLDLEAAGELLRTHGGGALLPRIIESAASVAATLEPFWSRDVAIDIPTSTRAGERDAEPPRKPYESAVDYYEGAIDKSALAWIRGAEEALATATALFLRHYMRPFRILTTVVLGSGLWMLLMVSTYAIDARRLSMTFIWVGVIAAASTGLWMFIQFDRDELLSRIGHTTPGEVTFDGGFARRVFTWGLLPIVSVAAVHYPNLTQSVFAWLQPLMLALR